MALLSTEDSKDSQKRMRAVLTIHPTLAYPFFSLIRFSVSCPKGVGYARVYCRSLGPLVEMGCSDAGSLGSATVNCNCKHIVQPSTATANI